MPDYDFTLKFRLPDTAADPGDYLDALAEAGCEDALVGIGQAGRLALDFTREARTAVEAVASAVRDVKRAVPGAELVEAGPDLVGLTDVADLAGFSRQNMRKLMLGNPATFPSAVHEGNPSLWHLAQVLAWLAQTQGREVDAALLEVATATMTLNSAKESLHVP